MKKLLLVAALMLSTQAFAGGYEESEIKYNYCDAIGQVGQNNYTMRTDGEPLAEAMSEASDVLADEKKSHMSLTLFSIKYAYGAATSERDAYMRSFAHCMDAVADLH